MNPPLPASGVSSRFRGTPYALVGVGFALLCWQLFASSASSEQFRAGFSPKNTARELIRFIDSGAVLRHGIPSLQRVGTGLGIAIAAGVPIGILVGYFVKLNQVTNVVFQFIRMTSPLAWMPVAIIVFGVGARPVVFLIAVAAIWPIIISTAHGVRSVNRNWIKVVRMLGGKHVDVLRRAVVPAILPDVLNGIRISLGVSWIILVPAEMLGVSSGLGYYILDTRDRFNYGELMAVILVIGFLGFVSDATVRQVQRAWSWRPDSELGLVP